MFVCFAGLIVALRKESVDRNVNQEKNARKAVVALRKESVDRNPLFRLNSQRLSMSLSARRAWIEIRLVDMSDAWHRVALRKESVDRNRPT